MADYYTDHMVSGAAIFKLLPSYIELKGTGTIITYQNIGAIPVTIQGSLDNINWSTITEIEPAGSKVIQQSWNYLRQLEPLAEVMVSRGLD